ncbi:hypothetical protein BDB00DRAFT_587581 [Zychaea mexicana]|uniref:uncharacterized protein n=1 Tax=Zychaea mexicana TaxID=64656 RepID=UPI0022FE9C46|nr:uncharacterized protein BDB00DRAFT_587581 [Zychaea mexicana]KAI9497712.1 hypothetical protein BDB00DRAFT_587581 [Zychaea mexicana]
MDYYSTVYGFGIPPLLLGAIAAVGAVIQAARKRQFYWRYVFMFLAGIFQCIRNITFMVAALGNSENSNSAYISGTLSRVFMFQMFIPFMFSAFFEVCRTVINSSISATAATGPATVPSGTTAYNLDSNPRTKLYSNARKLSPTYLAHLWTLILIIVNVAYCATLSSSYKSYDFTVVPNVIIGMLQFSTYGVWAYVAYAIAHLAMGWKELKCCSISLLSFFCTIVLATIGNTVATVISSQSIYTSMTVNIISLIMVDVIGLLGLLYAVLASTRYWPPQPKTVAANQPYYAYTQSPFGTSPQQQQQYVSQPPQMFMNTAAGSASQLYQQQQQQHQQYPIVQIPQQQLQSGQFPIVQIPISQQQQPGQQYPIVQVQPIMQQQYPQAGQFIGQQQYH